MKEEEQNTENERQRGIDPPGKTLEGLIKQGYENIYNEMKGFNKMDQELDSKLSELMPDSDSEDEKALDELRSLLEDPNKYEDLVHTDPLSIESIKIEKESIDDEKLNEIVQKIKEESKSLSANVDGGDEESLASTDSLKSNDIEEKSTESIHENNAPFDGKSFRKEQEKAWEERKKSNDEREQAELNLKESKGITRKGIIESPKRKTYKIPYGGKNIVKTKRSNKKPKELKEFNRRKKRSRPLETIKEPDNLSEDSSLIVDSNAPKTGVENSGSNSLNEPLFEVDWGNLETSTENNVNKSSSDNGENLAEIQGREKQQKGRRRFKLPNFLRKKKKALKSEYADKTASENHLNESGRTSNEDRLSLPHNNEVSPAPIDDTLSSYSEEFGEASTQDTPKIYDELLFASNSDKDVRGKKGNPLSRFLEKRRQKRKQRIAEHIARL